MGALKPAVLLTTFLLACGRVHASDASFLQDIMLRAADELGHGECSGVALAGFQRIFPSVSTPAVGGGSPRELGFDDLRIVADSISAEIKTGKRQATCVVDPGHFGMYNPQDLSIQISDSLCSRFNRGGKQATDLWYQEQLALVMIHEMTHAFEFRFDSLYNAKTADGLASLKQSSEFGGFFWNGDPMCNKVGQTFSPLGSSVRITEDNCSTRAQNAQVRVSYALAQDSSGSFEAGARIIESAMLMCSRRKAGNASRPIVGRVVLGR